VPSADLELHRSSPSLEVERCSRRMGVAITSDGVSRRWPLKTGALVKAVEAAAVAGRV
jgi:hypothetical protein